jgi:phage-related protein
MRRRTRRLGRAAKPAVEIRHLAWAYLNRYAAVVLPLHPVLEVRFHATDQGREPVRDWLKSLPPGARKAIGEDLKTVQFGWPLGMPLVRKMEPGLWETRSTIDAGIARVLFTTVGPVMVLLHGFVKKTGKTPMGDLKLALRRMKEVRHG